MFQQLEALVRASGKLQITLKMDNDRMAVVIVPQGDGKEAALRQPLVLTATPAELDEGFAAAILSYSSVHASLSEQVAVTAAILQEAEKSLASKAQKSLAKGGTASRKSATEENEAGGTDDGEAGESQASSESQLATAASPAADKAAGTDLFALLS
jgi:PRTRC genetic system protein E